LEKNGIISQLTRVLVGLYEEPERPQNAIDYIKKYLGAPTGVDVEELRSENEEPDFSACSRPTPSALSEIYRNLPEKIQRQIPQILTNEIVDYLQRPVRKKKCRIAGKIRCNDYFFLTNASLKEEDPWGRPRRSSQGQTLVPAKCARKLIVRHWYRHLCEESGGSAWNTIPKYCTTISPLWWKIFSETVVCPSSRLSGASRWLAEQEQKIADLQNVHFFTPYDQWTSLSDSQEYLQAVLEGEMDYAKDITLHGGDHEAMLRSETNPWASRTLRSWDAERLGLKVDSEELRQALEDEEDTKAKRIAFSQRAVQATEDKLEVVTAYVADLKGYVQRWQSEGQGDLRSFRSDDISTSDEALDAAAYIIRRYQWSKACITPVKLSQMNLHLPNLGM